MKSIKELEMTDKQLINILSSIRDAFNRVESQAYILSSKDLKECFNEMKLMFEKLESKITEGKDV